MVFRPVQRSVEIGSRTALVALSHETAEGSSGPAPQLSRRCRLPHLRSSLRDPGRTPGEHLPDELVPNRLGGFPALALGSDEPAQMNVARARETEPIALPTDAPTDLCDWLPPVVQRPSGCSDALVVTRSTRRHLSSLAPRQISFATSLRQLQALGTTPRSRLLVRLWLRATRCHHRRELPREITLWLRAAGCHHVEER